MTERINPHAKPKDPKTHFEQVPLEIVKKIAEEDIPDDESERTRRGSSNLRQKSEQRFRVSEPARVNALELHIQGGVRED